MSGQTTQQATIIGEEKSVATKEFPVTTEIAKDSKKSYRDRVDRMKIKCLSRQEKLCRDKLQKDKDMRRWLQTGWVLRHKAFLSRQEQDW